MSNRLLIFCWHNVEGTYGFPAPPGAGTAGLIRQFELLARFTNVVSLTDAIEAWEKRRRLPLRAVVLTFDDGYRDNLEVAAPILQRCGLPATFFLAPDLLDGIISPWWEELAWAMHFSSRRSLRWGEFNLSLESSERARSYGVVVRGLKLLDEIERRRSVRALVNSLEPQDPAGSHRSPIMGWDEAQALQRQGFTIGSHSLSHSILARESACAQAEDLTRSRRALQEHLGCSADLLAYPNGDVGDFDHRTVQASVDAGYRAAVTTIQGWNRSGTPPMELRRFIMYPERGIAGFGILPLDLARRARRRLRRRGEIVASRGDGDGELETATA
ncbi:MAG: polysaccharide deacetylase family protein [Actinomycetota bacterium]|nr:polysaccharide deacetylase family protein [Actinomycetota bacterium]